MLCLVLILICGFVTYLSIPKESAPDINMPVIKIKLKHAGISPEDAERLLITPIEQELKGIDNTKDITSKAFEGGGQIIIKFNAGFDIDVAMDSVREKIDLVKPELPKETEEPEILEDNLSLRPAIVVAISGKVPERSLFNIALNMRDAIESIPSVLEVNLSGDRDEMVEVLLNPSKMETYHFAGNSVANIFHRNNTLVAAGYVDSEQGQYSLKVPGLFESVLDVLNLPIKVKDESVIRVKDVAEVKRTFKDAESFASVNGEPAIILSVVKRTGQNIIDMIDQVKSVVAAEQQNLPNEVKVTLVQDKSTQIRTMLSDLQNSVIFSILLVMVTIIWALGMRSGILVMISIPGAFLAGILVLNWMSVTVNIAVLFGLILAVGLLVDGAIVVTEYADRKMHEGQDCKSSYFLAANRMAWPIIASTATTLAAFSPLLFWPGIVGEFMKYLPITLVSVLVASLLMALIFVPTVGSLIGGWRCFQGGGQESDDMSLKPGICARVYETILRVALKNCVKVLIAAVVFLVLIWSIYGKIGKGVEFFPQVEADFARVVVRARGNLSYLEKDRLVKKVEKEILSLQNEFDSLYTTTGNLEALKKIAEDAIGVIYIELTDWQHRRKASVITEDIIRLTKDFPGIEVEVLLKKAGPPTGKDVQIQLRSQYPELMENVADIIRKGLKEIGQLKNIDEGKPLPGIEWNIQVDRAEALKYGTDVASIGRMLTLLTSGFKIAEYRPSDSIDEIDIKVRYPIEQRTVEQINQMRINTPKGAVPLTNFIKREPKPKTGTLNRFDGRRVITLKADVEEGILVSDKINQIKSWLQSQPIDNKVKVVFKGQDEERREARQFLIKAFSIALFIMGIILVTQFNSFYSTFLILMSVVMSTVGVLMGLLLMGQPFGVVMTGVGIVALAGIVVNNNIVLIDTYDVLKHTCNSPFEAIVQTGLQRLRPVMLTTVTTILGLMPMVTQVTIDFFTRSVSIGAPSTQWWVQLSSAIVFGLGFATILTLIVTPCAIMLPHKLKVMAGHHFRFFGCRSTSSVRDEK